MIDNEIEENENIFEQFEWLDHYAPCFEIDSDQIEVLEEPKQFYNSLKEIFSKSKNRILISSLYIGTSDLEKDLVDSIETSLKQTNSSNRVKILLDYSRGLRGQNNSKTLLQRLITSYKNRFQLCLYHTPQLRGIAKKVMPDRYNETIGVLHMKIYISDDTLIISGANLSNDYFVNRQDRYICIKNCPKLCDFFESLIDSISEYSFKVNEKGDVNYENVEHPYEGNIHEFSQALSKSIRNVLNTYYINANSQTHHHNDTNKAYIYPLVQIHDCNLISDELVTKRIFELALSNSKIYLAAGYFNLTQEYERMIVMNSKANFDILIASPQANGFFNATGFAKNIPKVYSHLEENFVKYLEHHKQDKRVQLYEYARDNWTFHAKGLWYYPRNSSLPSLTLIGSSNYGHRSVYRDLEAQLVIYSKNAKLQNDLHEEQKKLFQSSSLVTRDFFLNDARRLPITLRFLTRIIRSFF